MTCLKPRSANISRTPPIGAPNWATDANGKATAEFKLPDSLTDWQVVVTAVSKDLHVGKHQSAFRSSKPIMLMPMLPRFFVEGDSVELFANVLNRSTEKQTIKVKLEVENGKILGNEERTITLAPDARERVVWKVQAGKQGSAQLLLSADCKAGKDAALEKLPVLSSSAEQQVTWFRQCDAGRDTDFAQGHRSQGRNA